jgi:hypothetical protein
MGILAKFLDVRFRNTRVLAHFTLADSRRFGSLLRLVNWGWKRHEEQL